MAFTHPIIHNYKTHGKLNTNPILVIWEVEVFLGNQN